MQEQTHVGHGTGTRLIYRVKAGDIEHGGMASARIKSDLIRLGIDEDTARRAGIVSFEGEMNLMVYSSHGGTITVTLLPDAVELRIEDDGPGIGDIDLALTPGFSTAPDWATDLGFGAGMGLPNMQRNSKRFEIHSHVDEGTLVVCHIARRVNDDS